jgi:hypothetical protein
MTFLAGKTSKNFIERKRQETHPFPGVFLGVFDSIGCLEVPSCVEYC